MAGYEDYNLGKDGYFWRGVAPDWSALDDTSLCSRLMVWQDAGDGSADRTPPCGIRYLRASGGEPYRLTASITCGLDLRPRPSRTLLRVRVGRGLPRGNSYG
ncbi:hypothetical protein OOK48_19470 [Streptomyces viridodiastaticus]|uniref:hypothetical protein n=1 Tax=Streptomyces albogriseolus TaxID=1887 RepID=UPI00225B9D1C|nr:hypothetical protein [Streptomyces viridodiastaticus]MCX4568510.1 hypothetical protein [Streptomyces viridodiastaticus]